MVLMISPGLEPETLSVLDSRDNQLHHETKERRLHDLCLRENRQSDHCADFTRTRTGDLE